VAVHVEIPKSKAEVYVPKKKEVAVHVEIPQIKDSSPCSLEERGGSPCRNSPNQRKKSMFPRRRKWQSMFLRRRRWQSMFPRRRRWQSMFPRRRRW